MGNELSQDHDLLNDCMVDARVNLNLPDTLLGNGYNTLATLLVKNGVDLPAGTYSVFAPTDAAFAQIKTAGLKPEQLLNIIKYHVVPSRILCKETLHTIAGEEKNSDDRALETLYTKRHLWISQSQGQLRINTAGVVQANSNVFFNDAKKGVRGVIIGIDKVLTPCGNTTDTLEEALQNRVLLKMLRDLDLYGTLTADSSMFTLFAPPDGKLTDALLQNGKLKVPEKDAIDALKSHVVHGCFTQSTLANMLGGAERSITIENLRGECLKFTLQNAKVVVETKAGFVGIGKEAQHANGVVHDVKEILSDVACDAKAIKKRRPKAR